MFDLLFCLRRDTGLGGGGGADPQQYCVPCVRLVRFAGSDPCDTILYCKCVWGSVVMYEIFWSIVVGVIAACRFLFVFAVYGWSGECNS